MILRNLREWIRNRSVTRRSGEISKKFSVIYGVCPHCLRGIGSHEFLELASSRPWIDGSQVAILHQAIQNQDWSAASSIHEFVANEDALVFTVFRCPDVGAGLLIEEESFVDFFADPRILRSEPLSIESIDAISKIFGGEWSSVRALVSRAKS